MVSSAQSKRFSLGYTLPSRTNFPKLISSLADAWTNITCHFIEEAIARVEVSAGETVVVVNGNDANFVLTANILEANHWWISMRFLPVGTPLFTWPHEMAIGLSHGKGTVL